MTIINRVYHCNEPFKDIGQLPRHNLENISDDAGVKCSARYVGRGNLDPLIVRNCTLLIVNQNINIELQLNTSMYCCKELHLQHND